MSVAYFPVFFVQRLPATSNPGLLFSASLSGTYTLPVNSTIQFVIQGTTSTDSPQYMVVASANATINRIGN